MPASRIMKPATVVVTALCFLVQTLLFSTPAHADILNSLPLPGMMVRPSDPFVPVLLRGMTLHPEDPMRFDFIVDSGETGADGGEVRDEAEKAVRYFMAALTVPEDDLWVNLSPYEGERIIPDELSRTELGRDLLAQDYLLKQITASLMYPEDDLGAKFWERVYARAAKELGRTDIPVDTFNKVWIMPESASVYEHGGTVYITGAKLKVMLEEDYVAMREAGNVKRENAATVGAQHAAPVSSANDASDTMTRQIVRETILPAIEREVNEGRHFAALRQIYYALILAKWYKQTVQRGLLSQVYVNRHKLKGIDLADPALKNAIYDRYIAAYKKGVFNYIKADYDNLTHQPLPRKYFSGGFVAGGGEIHATRPTTDGRLTEGKSYKTQVVLSSSNRSQKSEALFDSESVSITKLSMLATATSSIIFPSVAFGISSFGQYFDSYPYGVSVMILAGIWLVSVLAVSLTKKLQQHIVDRHLAGIKLSRVESVKYLRKKNIKRAAPLLEDVLGKVNWSQVYLSNESFIREAIIALGYLGGHDSAGSMESLIDDKYFVLFSDEIVEALTRLGAHKAILRKAAIKRQLAQRLEKKIQHETGMAGKDLDQTKRTTLFSRVVELYREGFNFEIVYEPEISHMESDIDEDDQWNGVGGTPTPMGGWPERKVVDSDMKMEVVGGEKLEEGSDFLGDSRGGDSFLIALTTGVAGLTYAASSVITPAMAASTLSMPAIGGSIGGVIDAHPIAFILLGSAALHFAARLFVMLWYRFSIRGNVWNVIHGDDFHKLKSIDRLKRMRNKDKVVNESRRELSGILRGSGFLTIAARHIFRLLVVDLRDRDPQVIPLVLSALAADDPEIRAVAEAVLEEMETSNPHEFYINVLYAIRGHDHIYSRNKEFPQRLLSKAANYITRLGRLSKPGDRRAIEAILPYLQLIGDSVEDALIRLGAKQEVVRHYVERLSGIYKKNEIPQKAIIERLGDFGVEEAVPAVLPFLGDDQLFQVAESALRASHASNAQWIEGYEKALNTPSSLALAGKEGFLAAKRNALARLAQLPDIQNVLSRNRGVLEIKLMDKIQELGKWQEIDWDYFRELYSEYVNLIVMLHEFGFDFDVIGHDVEKGVHIRIILGQPFGREADFVPRESRETMSRFLADFIKLPFWVRASVEPSEAFRIFKQYGELRLATRTGVQQGEEAFTEWGPYGENVGLTNDMYWIEYEVKYEIQRDHRQYYLGDHLVKEEFSSNNERERRFVSRERVSGPVLGGILGGGAGPYITWRDIKPIEIVQASDSVVDQSLVTSTDQASENPGGIDMTAIGVDRSGAGVDEAYIAPLPPFDGPTGLDAEPDGFVPVFLNFTPLDSILPMLGLSEDRPPHEAARSSPPAELSLAR